MPVIAELFENNRRWAESLTRDRPDFFAALEAVQRPEYVWIGCSDSRVPANDIVGLLPGELFVHRNVANVVSHTDLNCLSVLQFAVDALHVKHVIVCGHYGCGGVRAALENARLGLIDNWLRHVQDVRGMHRAALEAAEPNARVNLLCELNVVEQARHVCETTVVQDAWARGQRARRPRLDLRAERRPAAQPRLFRGWPRQARGRVRPERGRVPAGIIGPFAGSGQLAAGSWQAGSTSGHPGGLMAADLTVTFTGLRFENPFLLSSAPPTESDANIMRAFDAGWGGVVTKTIGLHPVTNVAGPKTKFLRADPDSYRLSMQKRPGTALHSSWNWELISDKTIDWWLPRLRRIKEAHPDRILVASIMAGSGSDRELRHWQTLATACRRPAPTHSS
jgi:carbonic anhydrase